MRRKRLGFVTALLIMFETSFCRGGEYFREMAVLIVVFIPIDLWLHTGMTGLRIFYVAVASLGLFTVGMGCEWTYRGVKRGRRAWEAEEAEEEEQEEEE